MKNFCKWLGVNEKIAKLVIWLFIGMCFLIVTNVLLESIGLPYYKITVQNLSKIELGKLLDFGLASIVCLLNFYTAVFLVFRIKEFKKIFPYSIIYVLLNIVFSNLSSNIATNNIIVQVFIVIFILLFCYLYSGKKFVYVLYGLASYVINTLIQYICYLYKLRFIDYENISQFNRFVTSLDFLMIMMFIILIKEIIIKRREVK